MDEALDYLFILPLIAHRYDAMMRRPAVHPEQTWRLLYALYYLNLSDEKVALEAHRNLALRLFLRLDVHGQPPHPTTPQESR